jgi:hypothetical protein
MKISNLTVLAILSLTGVCCTSEDLNLTHPINLSPDENTAVKERQAVIDAYEAVMGVIVPEDTRQVLAHIVINRMSLAQLLEVFPGMNENTLARVTNDGIWVRDDLGARVESQAIAHEFIHALRFTLLHDGDNCHEDPLMFSCDESAEHMAWEILGVNNAYTSSYKCGVNSCLGG